MRNTEPDPFPVHVAVGVVRNALGQILIAKRPDHVDQGGLWEFPGGKVDPGESVKTALKRELNEELGIQVLESAPLIQVRHRYADRRVLLDVFEVKRYHGDPHGREGQPLAWVMAEELHRYRFPAADRPIVSAICLPQYYAVLENAPDAATYRQRFQQLIMQGHRLIYWRACNLRAPTYWRLAMEFCHQADALQATVMLRGSAPKDFPAAGCHLTSAQLSRLSQRPGSRKTGAACHTLEELQRADSLQLDFAVLSPIRATATHPKATPIGWDTAKNWLEHVNLPVYLMGGLQISDLRLARQMGTQGIAGIRLFQDSKIQI